MKRFLSLSMCLLLMVTFAGFALAGDNAARDYSKSHHIAIDSGHNVLTSTSGAARFKVSAGTDTFCLYGGPGSTYGKFQTPSFAPLSINDLLTEPSTMGPGTGLGEADGWTLVDATDQESFWQYSTFNMANLNTGGPTNIGAWAGRSTTDEPGWANAPGYGNSWNSLLVFRETVSPAQTGQAQTVTLDFVYNHDSELGYDFFEAEYDSGGTTIILLSTSGTNKDSAGVYAAPGVVASLTAPIEAGAYAGNGANEIILRLAGRSDGGLSDEDEGGDFDGIAQVDDITVTWDANADGVNESSNTEDFETAPYSWNPEKAPFAGFFGKIFGSIKDNGDICRENVTPVFAFLDDSQPPSNPSYTGTGTGGTTSLNWSYGVTGGWVINYNGGLTANEINLENQLYIPATAWDLPGTEDDGADVAGAFFRMTIWRHLPLSNGMFYTWDVRARDSVTNEWTGWANRGFVYFGGGQGDWLNVQNGVSDLTATDNGRDGVQLRVIALDAATVFAFPGTDATVSPFFDNVAFFKFRIAGPAFSSRNIDLFNDSFPQSGATASGTTVERDAMDVRVDMARDIRGATGLLNVPGDSIIVDVANVIPGNSLPPGNVSMEWALHKNPYFEDSIRENLTGYAGATSSAGAGQNGWDVWRGSEPGAPSGAGDEFFFDLPDEDFFYPGDVIEWYILATDDGAVVGPLTTTFPGGGSATTDPPGFGDADKSNYNRTFTIRALPTITANGQPDLLLINDFGRRGGENDYQAALGQLGFEEGADSQTGNNPGGYDTYTVMGPSSNIDNGIGSNGAHGATGAQLAGYSTAWYVSGDLTNNLLSDGTDTGQNDKGDDLGAMTTWHGQAAPRHIAYFGDGIGTALSSTGTGTGSAIGDTYRTAIMGVTYGDNDVKDEIGGTTAPLVTPTGAVGVFVADFTAFGGCLRINQFDSITPEGGAVKAHQFSTGTPAPAAASVVWDRFEGGNRKVNVTFPFGFEYIFNGGSTGAGGGLSDRTVLLGELFTLFGTTGGSGDDVTSVDKPGIAPSVSGLQAVPSPFNPSTEIKFTLGVKGPVTVKVYNLAGRLVKTLASNEIMEAGLNSVPWNGIDNTGASVASGVYIARVAGNNMSKHVKMALVK